MIPLWGQEILGLGISPAAVLQVKKERRVSHGKERMLVLRTREGIHDRSV